MSRKSAAVLLACATFAAACGARTAPYLGAGANQTGGVAPGANGQNSSNGTVAPGSSGGAVTPGGSNGGPGTTTLGGGSNGPVSSNGSNGGTQTAGGVTLDNLSPSNFPFTSPAAQAALCQGTAGNTASDKGVSPTSINVGNVSGLTGILVNNFNQGPEAVQALFSAINAAGGICGRTLKLQVEDDGQDSTKNASDVDDLLSHVLAFVGSTSDGDNGGVPEMQSANAPDIGAAISANRGASPMYLSPAGATQYVKNGHAFLYNSLQNGLKAYNDFPTRLAALSYQIPISKQAAEEFVTSFVKAGAVSCYTDYGILPTTTSLDQDVIQMKANHCDGVYTTMDVTGNAKLLKAEQLQGFTPRYNATTFDAYTPTQIAVSGEAAAQGLQVTLPFIPFNENNPVIGAYLNELQTYEPGKQPSGFGVLSWASAEMFVYGLLKAGRNPTRASLVSALMAIDSWDTVGATAPITPRLRLPSGPCTLSTAVKGNDFVRTWPPSGFYCNGQFVDDGPVPPS